MGQGTQSDWKAQEQIAKVQKGETTLQGIWVYWGDKWGKVGIETRGIDECMV